MKLVTLHGSNLTQRSGTKLLLVRLENQPSFTRILKALTYFSSYIWSPFEGIQIIAPPEETV